MNIISKILGYLKKHKKLICRIAMTAVVIVAILSMVMTTIYVSLYNNLIESNRVERQEVDALEIQCEDLMIENTRLNHTAEKQAKQIETYKSTITDYEEQIKDLKTEIKELKDQLDTRTLAASIDVGNSASPDEDYTQSTIVWNYLKGLGLNDYVCAGIMGNIMAEVGGHTLDISRYSCVDTGTYYGICQWGWGRKDRLLNDFGTSLEAQLQFLGVELFEIIPSDSSFYSMQDEQEAALYFAQYFERCSSSSYEVRQSNASVALDYFT